MDIENLLIKHSAMIVVVGAAVIILNVLIYGFGVSRLDHFAGELKKKVEVNRTVLAKTLVKRDKLVQTARRVENDRDVIAKLNNDVFKTRGSRLVSVQEEIQELAEKNHLETRTISYSYSTYPNSARLAKGWKHHYEKISMNIPLSGTYPSIKSFISDLQTSDQFLMVDALALSSSTQSGVMLKVNLSVETYFVMQPSGKSGRTGGTGT